MLALHDRDLKRIGVPRVEVRQTEPGADDLAGASLADGGLTRRTSGIR